MIATLKITNGVSSRMIISLTISILPVQIESQMIIKICTTNEAGQRNDQGKIKINAFWCL
jgi:hypothetical protein